jgi:hypothetical protein
LNCPPSLLSRPPHTLVASGRQPLPAGALAVGVQWRWQPATASPCLLAACNCRCQCAGGTGVRLPVRWWSASHDRGAPATDPTLPEPHRRGRPLGSLAALVAVYPALSIGSTITPPQANRDGCIATPGTPLTQIQSQLVTSNRTLLRHTYYNIIWQPSETADALNDRSNSEDYDFSTLQLPPGGSWSTPSIQCDARSGGIFPLALFIVLFIVTHTTSLTLDPEWGLRASDKKRATLRRQYLLERGNRR